MFLWNPTFNYKSDNFYRYYFTLPISYATKCLINLSNVKDMGAPLTAYDRLFVENNVLVFANSDSSPQKTIKIGYGIQIYSIGY